MTEEELRAWGNERLAPWEIPTRVVVASQHPRNSMGKITKPAVSALFAARS